MASTALERKKDANFGSDTAKAPTGTTARSAESIDERADAMKPATDAAKFRGYVVHTFGFAATSSGSHTGFRWIAAPVAYSLGKRAGQVPAFMGQDAN